MPELSLSPFQQRVAVIPECYDVFLGGGRGGAKSYSMAVLALRHVEQYGNRARILFIRRTYKGLADFENLTRELFALVYGRSAAYNAQEHLWRFPNGAYLELGQLETIADYAKYQGRSFTLLLIDEAGQYAEPDLLDKLRSNLRGPLDIPIRCVVAANPCDPGHHWLARRYVFVGAPWAPFFESCSRREWVYAPSTFLDNPFIDRDAYRDQLTASCPTDAELLRAWLEGDWAVARGAFFASVLEEKRVAVAPWPHSWKRGDWHVYLAHDYGSAAPSVTYLVAESPGDYGPDQRFYPRGSLVLIDELATHRPSHLNVGLGWTVPRLAEEIRAFAQPWGMAKAHGCADDAIFAKHGSASGSIADEFRHAKVYFVPARKADRRSGWERMRRLLSHAGRPDVPGMYVSRRCAYFWQTVPFLARDPRRPDDVDSDGPDHAADAVRYAALYQRQRTYSIPLEEVL